MISFLKKYGINDKIVIEIERVNSDANLYNLNCNQEEVVKIIQCLRDIGVCCVDQFLRCITEIFFLSLEQFKKRYIKDNVDSFVKVINEDYMRISEL